MSNRVEPHTREMYPHFFSSTVLDPKTRVYRRVVGEPANLTLFDASIQRDFSASPCGDGTKPFVAKKVAFSVTESSYELRRDEFDSGDVWAMCYQDPSDDGQWYDSFIRYSILNRGR